MNIIVKPNTKKIKDYINAGCNAFILCLENFSCFTKVTFSLDDISKIISNNDVSVYVSIDKHIFNEDLDDLRKVLLKLNDMNIKGLFFYDLSILKLKKDLKLKFDLIWSPNFLVTNYKTCNFYHDLGVSGVTISNCILASDIEKILSNVNFKCFVWAFGYQLMSVSDRNLVSNYFSEVKEKNSRNKHYMIEDDRKFEIVETDICTFTLSDKIFDISLYLEKLKKYAPYLILDEISVAHNKFLSVLKLYNLDLVSPKEIESIVGKTSTYFLNTNTIVKVKR